MRVAFRRNIALNIYSVSFIFLLLLTLIASYVFLERTTLPPWQDGMRPLLTGMRVYNAWQHHRSFSEFADFFHPAYPPLIPICYAVYFFIFGLHTGKELMVNTVFLIITMISIYGISKALYNEKVALLAVAVFLSFPSVFKYSRFGFMEFAVMGMVSLSIYFLVLTDYFSNRRYAVIFGVVLGLTALTKWSFLLSLCGPLLVVALRSYIFKPKKDAHVLKWPVNFLISIMIAVMLSLPWYALHFRDFLQRFHSDRIDISYGNFSLNLHNASIFLNNLNFYMQAFTSNWWNQLVDAYHFLVFLCVIFFYAVAYAIKIIIRKPRYSAGLPKALLFFLWIAIPYITMSFPVFTEIRNYSHLLPVLPAVAITISAGVFGIPIKAARYVMLILVLLVAMPYWGVSLYLPFVHVPFHAQIPVRMQVSLNTFHQNRDCSKIFHQAAGNRIPIRLELIHQPASSLQRTFLLPSTENWLHKDVLSFITDDYGSQIEAPKVLLLGNDYVFRYYQFLYYNLQREKKVLLIEPYHAMSRFFRDVTSLENALLFDSFFDYIILKADSVGPLSAEAAPAYEIVDFMKAREKEFDRKYKNIKEFTLPNSSPVVIYKRIGI